MTTRTTTLFAKDLAATAPARAAPFHRVVVTAERERVLDAWAELERCAPCSIYQTRAFLLPWLDMLGERAGLTPCFVAAYDGADRPVALLTLGVRRRGLARVATWLGGSDANFNMPLFRRPADWSPADCRLLLKETARAVGTGRPDAFDLANQPADWAGSANPFAALNGTASPSAAYGLDLERDPEAVFAAKLSKDTRKKLRKKETKLASFGDISHRVAATADERAIILDAFLAQKVARFRELGIKSDFEHADMRRFIERASAADDAGIELHGLFVGERIVATYGGAAHAGQWSGMFNSFDGDEEIAKTSPGDLLLMRIIASCCRAGLRRFDLGIGEARYKAALCDQTIAMFDAFVPVTALGHLYVTATEARRRGKRAIKGNARIFAMLKRARIFFAKARSPSTQATS